MRDKNNTGKKSGAGFLMGTVVTALVAAIAVFVVMLKLEEKELSQYDKGDIYVASADISKGQLLDGDNIEKYIELKSVDVSLIPDTAVTDLEQIQDLYADCSIEKGVWLTSGMFDTVEEVTNGMSEPVIAGIKADDLYQVAGGVLRAGDRVHIYNTDENGNIITGWDDIYVQQVFDSSGKIISGADTESSAQRINIYINKSDVEEFYTGLKSGTLRVVKVCE
jgi:hypothetical protein